MAKSARKVLVVVYLFGFETATTQTGVTFCDRWRTPTMIIPVLILFLFIEYTEEVGATCPNSFAFTCNDRTEAERLNRVGKDLLRKGFYIEAVDTFNRSIIACSDDYKFHNNLGIALTRLYLSIDKPGLADTAVIRSAFTNARNHADTDQERSVVHGNFANFLSLYSARYDEAVRNYTEAIRLHNDNHKARYNLSTLYANSSSSPAQALNIIRDSTSGFTNAVSQSNIYQTIGHAYFSMGSHQFAYDTTWLAIDEQYDNEEAYRVLLSLLEVPNLQTGLRSEIIRKLKEQTRTSNRHAFAYLILEQNLGDSFGLFDSLAIITNNRDRASITAHSGYLFNQWGDWKTARDLFARAVRLEPNNLQYRYDYLRFVIEKGKLWRFSIPRRSETFERFLSLLPNDANIRKQYCYEIARNPQLIRYVRRNDVERICGIIPPDYKFPIDANATRPPSSKRRLKTNRSRLRARKGNSIDDPKFNPFSTIL